MSPNRSRQRRQPPVYLLGPLGPGRREWDAEQRRREASRYVALQLNREIAKARKEAAVTD